MNESLCRFYEFASFRVDVAERRLWRDGRVVPLTSKTFDILLALVENSGHTLDKNDLMERVWANTFVEEGNLNRNISTLRKILGDDSHEQRFIRTVPKQGYRFTAPVREITAAPEESLSENGTGAHSNVREEILKTKESVWSGSGLTAVLGMGLVLIAVVVSALLWNVSGNVSPSETPAVAATTNPEARRVFEQGRALWQTRRGEDLHEATLLLEQAVQKDPNFALAHAALADAYAFDGRNWTKAESEARNAIQLDPSLGEPHASIGFVRLFWEWRFQEAENEFKQAILLSPNYATAHQWYAINLFAFGNAGHAAYSEMKKALDLEPTSVSINADLCQALFFLHRYDEAIAQCQKTLAMEPDFYNAHLYLYEIYNAAGKHDEAMTTMIKLEELSLNPLQPDVRERLRDAYRTGGIQSYWQTRIDILPSKSYFHYKTAQYYARLGNKNDALNHLRKAYENREFELYCFLSDPVFDELRFEPRHQELKALLLSR